MVECKLRSDLFAALEAGRKRSTIRRAGKVKLYERIIFVDAAEPSRRRNADNYLIRSIIFRPDGVIEIDGRPLNNGRIGTLCASECLPRRELVELVGQLYGFDVELDLIYF